MPREPRTFALPPSPSSQEVAAVHVGLAEAIRDHVGQGQISAAELRAVVGNLPPGTPSLTAAAEAAAHRIALEAITNIIRHPGTYQGRAVCACPG